MPIPRSTNDCKITVQTNYFASGYSYVRTKNINEIIVKYLPKKYQTDSTFEFLSLLKNCNQQGMIASLNVDIVSLPTSPSNRRLKSSYTMLIIIQRCTRRCPNTSRYYEETPPHSHHKNSIQKLKRRNLAAEGRRDTNCDIII